jgi:hypothetical protein
VSIRASVAAGPGDPSLRSKGRADKASVADFGAAELSGHRVGLMANADLSGLAITLK